MIMDSNSIIHDPFYPFFNLDHALYIEQSIEELLGIKDKTLEGEIKL